jgi:hypothetical protein
MYEGVCMGGAGGGIKDGRVTQIGTNYRVHNQLVGASRHLVQPAQIMLVDHQIFLFLNYQCLNGTLIKKKTKFSLRKRKSRRNGHI